MYSIRQERPPDYPQVYTLVKESFATAEHADGDEQELVERLRRGEHFLPRLSLVAEAADGQLLGHILFTRLTPKGLLAVAPLAVLPAAQGKGIGTALLHEGHRIAKELGYTHAVLLGSETYYPRVGYRPATEFGIYAPMEVPPVNFMALDLQGDSPNPNCTIRYAPEFGL